MMKVHFYGKLASSAGKQIDVPSTGVSTVGRLRRHLGATYPQMADALQEGRVKAVVGETFVDDDHPLSADDEVEFLSPVSGG